MAKKEQIDFSITQEELVNELIKDINKGENNNCAFNLTSDESPSTIKDWISTGCTPLDLIISNGFSLEKSGIPSGRMIILTGLEGSSKTLIGCHILANCQKKGGLSVFIDSENSVMTEFMEAIGIDLSKMIYVQTQSVEKTFDVIEKVIKRVIEKRIDNKPTVIFVDSWAALRTDNSLITGDTGGYDPAKRAIQISEKFGKLQTEIGMRNIAIVYTTQLRDNMSAMAFGDPYRTTGGHALKYYPSVHIRLQRSGNLKKGNDIVGIKVKAKLLKNRMGPSFRDTEFIVRFDSGINDIDSILQAGNKYKIFGSGGSKSFITSDGEEHKIVLSDPTCLMNNTLLLSEVREKLREAIHIPYRNINETYNDGSELVDDEGEILDKEEE